MPSLQDLEDAIGVMEAYVAAQIPIIMGSLQKLTDDLRRYGPPELPPLPEMPPIPLFASIPPPPPPPPPPAPLSLTDKAGAWVTSHRRVLVGTGALIGLGLVAGGWMYYSSRKIAAAQTKAKAKTGKDVVVLLGADSPLGQLLISDLRANDYIVIASVSTPEATSEIERLGKGYVKALVLDPADPTSVIPFLRSLQSTLSLKFPIAAGDPYAPAPPAELPALVSLISLLSMASMNSTASSTVTLTGNLSSSASSASSAPVEIPTSSISNLSISQDYLPHLVATHLTPLNIIQSVIPLFKITKKKGKHASIVVPLRGGAESVGLDGQQAATAMANAAMAKGCEILRREIALNPDVSGTRVVLVDVGELAVRPRQSTSPRRPKDPRHFVNAVVRVVNRGNRDRYHHKSVIIDSLAGIKCRIRDLIRGDRFSVGAGAGTYALASHLPVWLLDTLVIIPQRLLAYRDYLYDKTQSFSQDVARERRRRKERERQRQAQEEIENAEGQAMVVVPKRSRPAASVTSSAGRDADAESEHTHSEPADSASEPDLDSGAPSGPPSEHGEHVGESWVMDVEGEHHDA